MAISVLENIKKAKKEGKKLLAVLLDPDKLDLETITIHIKELNKSHADYIFVGGSKVDSGLTDTFVTVIKKQSKIPIVLFPGDYRQISPNANAILFLSLLSGRNPEYLIEQQVQSIPGLMHLKLEIIPTGYILIDGGTITSTQKVSNTLPIPQNRIELIRNTSLAAEFLGNN
jgi:Predicted phosphate-binding enzymes, TIM-barrel fold